MGTLPNYTERLCQAVADDDLYAANGLACLAYKEEVDYLPALETAVEKADMDWIRWILQSAQRGKNIYTPPLGPFDAFLMALKRGPQSQLHQELAERIFEEATERARATTVRGRVTLNLLE